MSSGESDALDLAGALHALGSAPADDVVDAGFFHRTLARWLGLAEGKVEGITDPVVWDYDFWKATLEPLAHDGERETWAADLHHDDSGAAERVSWFVVKDGRGRIVEAGWLTAAPTLLAAVRADEGDVALDEATLARLADDADG